jgi:hypothetical protein
MWGYLLVSLASYNYGGKEGALESIVDTEEASKTSRATSTCLTPGEAWNEFEEKCVPKPW